MASMEENKSNHLADTAAGQVGSIKQFQPLMEAHVLLAEAIGDLKDNMEAQYLDV